MINLTVLFYVSLHIGIVDGIHLHRDPERGQDQGSLRVEQLTLQKSHSNQISLLDKVLTRSRACTSSLEGWAFINYVTHQGVRQHVWVIIYVMEGDSENKKYT